MFATTRLLFRPVSLFSLVWRFAALARMAASRHGSKSIEAWRAWRRREQDARTLRDMSDRELQDIGLGRGELPFVVSNHIDDRRRDGWW